MRASVIASVYNGEAAIAATFESILKQSLRDFELVIVDDGSTDNTLPVLQSYERLDSRVRIISQQNTGLTVALNRGCRAARGEFIFRQDVGDVSLPRRLEIQLAIFDNDPRVVAVDVGCRRLGPEGEFLGETVSSLAPEAVTRELRERGRGLLHPASAFRRAAFERVGGYRPEFRYAQDTDLWYRLSEVGLLATVPEVLFAMRVETTGISGQQMEKQVALAEIARRCHQRRLRGEPETDLLQQAREISAERGGKMTRWEKRRREANAAYLIGCLLMDQGDPRCRKYFARAAKEGGPLLRATGKYVYSALYCRRSRAMANGSN